MIAALKGQTQELAAGGSCCLAVDLSAAANLSQHQFFQDAPPARDVFHSVSRPRKTLSHYSGFGPAVRVLSVGEVPPAACSLLFFREFWLCVRKIPGQQQMLDKTLSDSNLLYHTIYLQSRFLLRFLFWFSTKINIVTHVLHTAEY